MRSAVRAMVLIAALAIWSAEVPSDRELEDAADTMTTDELVTDAVRYLESGKAMHLNAIDGMIRETAARMRRGGTDAQMRCLRTFIASAQKQRKRIEDSSALRVTAPALRIMNADPGNAENARKLAKDIAVLSVSVTNRLTAGHTDMQRCLFG